MAKYTGDVFIKPARRGDLTCHYGGQYDPQPTFIALNMSEGGLSAGYDPEIGGAVPMNVYHGFVRRYPIHTQSVVLANKLMRQIRPLAERVYAGYNRVWDGWNHVARLDDDAKAAECEIIRVLSEYAFTGERK